ncbi:MAG: hypothetical protein KJO44_07200, partial [Gemmatimonadetes bacterium]|nr:hypothetical protein [Gemmatimonadota bacterium]
RAHPTPKPPDGKAPVFDTVVLGCTKHSECGRVTYLGGSYWRVVSDMSYGDFSHEMSQLWDSKTELYWDPVPDERQKDPFKEGREYDTDLMLAPDGSWGIFEHYPKPRVLSFAEGKVLGKGEISGDVCGWRPRRP